MAGPCAGALGTARPGCVWVVGIDAVYLVEPDGAFQRVEVPADPGYVISDANGNAYVGCYGPGNLVRIDAVTLEATQVATTEDGLARAILRACAEVGLPEGKVDVSAIGNEPVNCLTTNTQTAKAFLDQLSQLYRFLSCESDGKLKFSYKAKRASQAVIPENALSGNAEKPNQQSALVQRIDEVDLPTRVSLTYADPSRSYHSSTFVMQLVNSQLAENPLAVQTPFAFDDAQARRVCENLLYEPWRTRESLQFTLPPMCLELDPTDVITVSARDVTYPSRLVELSVRSWMPFTTRRMVFDPSLFTHSSDRGLIFDPEHNTLFDPIFNPNEIRRRQTDRRRKVSDFYPITQDRGGLLVLDAPPLSILDATPRYLAVGCRG